MISAIIHLGNRDWASLVDDFVSLNFLPTDCNRSKIIPVRPANEHLLQVSEAAATPGHINCSRRRFH